MKEQTFVIIKPDGLPRHLVGKILGRLEDELLVIKKLKVSLFQENILKLHYHHLIDKPFYKDLEDYMTSGECVFIVLEGDNAVTRVRELVGATDPKLAESGTIRNIYGESLTRNLVHASDSKESAELEISRFELY